MTCSFETLPFEIYLALEEYLSLTDTILLSQTSNKLRHVFGSLSWRTCQILTNTQTHSESLNNTGFHDLIVTSSSPSSPTATEQKRVRAVSDHIFLNPEQYSWFRPGSVRKTVFNDLQSLVHSANNRNNPVLSDVLKFYPKLSLLKFASNKSVESFQKSENHENLEDLENFEIPEKWREMLKCHLNVSPPKKELECQLDLTFEKYTKYMSLEHDQQLNAFEPHVNLSELTITNWGTKYFPEDCKYRDFKPRHLKRLSINVIDPQELRDIFACLNTLEQCDHVVVTMLYIFTKSLTANTGTVAQYTIDTLECLQYIPDVRIKNIELNIDKLSALFYNASKGFFHTVDSYEKQMEKNGCEKLVVDQVTSISGAFEHCAYLDRLAQFPNLNECFSLSDISSLSCRLPPNHNNVYFLNNITTLDLAGDSQCHRLFMSIQHFTNVKYLRFRIQDDVSLFAKREYYEYITQTAQCGFVPASVDYLGDDFVEFVQNIGSQHYQQIQEIARKVKDTYIDVFVDELYKRDMAQGSGSHIWRLFFMDCFLYSLRSLKQLEQVNIEARGTQHHGRLFSLRIQDLISACEKLQNISVQLKHFDKSNTGKCLKEVQSGMDVQDFALEEGSNISSTISYGVDQAEKEYYYLLEYYSNPLV